MDLKPSKNSEVMILVKTFSMMFKSVRLMAVVRRRRVRIFATPVKYRGV